MNKSFTLASLITVIMLVLAYLGFTPSYISVTISICAFFIAISNFVNSAIHILAIEIKDILEKDNETLLKSFENLYDKLNLLAKKIEENKISSESQSDKLHSVMAQGHITMGEISNLVSQSMMFLSSKLDEQFKSMNEKNDAFTKVVNMNSTEVVNLNATITSLRNEIKESSEQILTSTNQYRDNLSKTFNNLINSITQQILSFVNKLQTLDDSIGTYTSSSKELHDSISILSTDIYNAVKSINDSISTISVDSHRMIDDLKFATSNDIDELLKGIKNITTMMTQSFSDGEEEIRKNINKLCNNLSLNMQKLEIDINAICESVEDIKKMSQSVEQSDKDLLARISKLCK